VQDAAPASKIPVTFRRPTLRANRITPGQKLQASTRPSICRLTDPQPHWRCAEGEIDIVAAERQVLMICELKTRAMPAGTMVYPG
jgi:Uncharacterised protein family UPF0102